MKDSHTLRGTTPLDDVASKGRRAPSARLAPASEQAAKPSGATRRSKPQAGGANRRELKANTEFAGYCHALALPVRVRILKMLVREHCMFGDLSKRIPLAQSTLSQHMKILADAGLVDFENVGQNTCWCVSSKGVAALKSMVADL